MREKGPALALTATVVLITSTGAAAQTMPQPAQPAQLQRLLACRAITDTQQRLACFDREAVALAQAVQRRDLVMIDRERARAAQRSLFGFSVPNFGGLLGGGSQNEVNEVEAIVAFADFNRDGGWTIRLKDGSVWTQTDDTVVPLKPKAGEKVIIKRATFGSFFMKVGRQPGFRARRIG